MGLAESMFIEREIGTTSLLGLCSSQIASCEAIPANWASYVLALFLLCTSVFSNHLGQALSFLCGGSLFLIVFRCSGQVWRREACRKRLGGLLRSLIGAIPPSHVAFRPLRRKVCALGHGG